MADDLAGDALRAIDTVLSDRPNKVGHDFSEATRRLSAWRDALVESWRQTHSEGDRSHLDRVNAAISVVLGGQFPLASIPWPLIERTRQDLAELAATDH